MRTAHFLISFLGTILMSTGVVTAHAAEGIFYDPSNAASPTGYTIGYELYRTIGCPGRELLGIPCPVPAPLPVAAAPPIAAAPAPMPAPYVAPEPAPAPAPRMELVLEGVNFDFDQSILRSVDLPAIDRDAAALDKWRDVNIEVAGHTDNWGSDEYNVSLSLRRAVTVRDYLISKGIAADRLSARAYGESQPVADNATDEGRFKNRRVELIPLKRAELLDSKH